MLNFTSKRYTVIVLALLLLVLSFSFIAQVPAGKVLGADTITPFTLAINTPPAQIPFQAKSISPPQLTAAAYLVLEPQSHTILWGKNAQQKVPIASLTKIMTALVAYENYPLDKQIVVPEIEEDGSLMGLNKGEIITTEALLWGLLLNSGNDAAQALAAAYPGGATKFVSAMNQKARKLSLNNTHFTNPVGWNNKDHYSTAMDLAHLTWYFLKQPLLAQMVSTQAKIVTSVPVENSRIKGGKRWHHLKNTNPLLGKITGVRGIKTGFTTEAGQCLITYVERKGRKLLIVILGSNNREEETEELISWGFKGWK